MTSWSSPRARASGPTIFPAWPRARTGFTTSKVPARCATRSPTSRAARSSSTSMCRTSARWRRSRSPSCCATSWPARGVIDKSEITYTYPIGRLHALEPVAKWAVPEFDRFGIKSEIFFNTKSVDAKGENHHLGRGHHASIRPPDRHSAAQRPAGDHRFQSRRRRLGADRSQHAAARRLQQRLRRRRHHQHSDLESRLDRAFRGRHHRRQSGLADQGRPLGAQTTTARCSASSRPD